MMDLTYVVLMDYGKVGEKLLGDINGDGMVNGSDYNAAVSKPASERIVPITTYQYDAFGTTLNPDTDDVNPFRYCGEYLDLSSGLYYLRNRYYSPGTGRFITEDPIRNGNNWYIYAANNPIMFVDPWGLAEMLRDLVAKTTGSIDWVGGNDFRFWLNKNTAYVNIDGKEQQYNVKGTGVFVGDKKVGYLQDERIWVEESDFNEDFKLAGTLTIASYHSPDEAFYIPSDIPVVGGQRADYLSGHAYIEYTPFGSATDTYGTHPSYEKYGTTAGMYKNFEPDRNLMGDENTAKYSRRITENQWKNASSVINDPQNNTWTHVNNCTPFATKVFAAGTGTLWYAPTPAVLKSIINARR